MKKWNYIKIGYILIILQLFGLLGSFMLGKDMSYLQDSPFTLLGYFLPTIIAILLIAYGKYKYKTQDPSPTKHKHSSIPFSSDIPRKVVAKRVNDINNGPQRKAKLLPFLSKMTFILLAICIVLTIGIIYQQNKLIIQSTKIENLTRQYHYAQKMADLWQKDYLNAVSTSPSTSKYTFSKYLENHR